MHSTDQTPRLDITIGTILPNGAIVCLIGGDYDSRVVLAHDPHNEVTPWITWYLTESGHTCNGNYFQTQRGAIDDYQERAGHVQRRY